MYSFKDTQCYLKILQKMELKDEFILVPNIFKIHDFVSIYTFTHKEVIKNWLTRLWGLPVRDLGELMVSSWSGSKSKGRRRPISHLKNRQREQIVPLSLCALFWPATYLMRPTHTGEDHLLHSVYTIQKHPPAYLQGGPAPCLDTPWPCEVDTESNHYSGHRHQQWNSAGLERSFSNGHISAAQQHPRQQVQVPTCRTRHSNVAPQLRVNLSYRSVIVSKARWPIARRPEGCCFLWSSLLFGKGSSKDLQEMHVVKIKRMDVIIVCTKLNI